MSSKCLSILAQSFLPAAPGACSFPWRLVCGKIRGEGLCTNQAGTHPCSDFSVVVMKSSRACSRHQLSGPVDLWAHMSAPRVPLEDLLTVVPPVIHGAQGNGRESVKAHDKSSEDIISLTSGHFPCLVVTASPTALRRSR